MTNPNNEPTPISEWIKRAASAAEFIENTIPHKKTPIKETPVEKNPRESFIPSYPFSLL